jgi:hypothetical protein
MAGAEKCEQGEEERRRFENLLLSFSPCSSFSGAAGAEAGR